MIGTSLSLVKANGLTYIYGSGLHIALKVLLGSQFPLLHRLASIYVLLVKKSTRILVRNYLKRETVQC